MSIEKYGYKREVTCDGCGHGFGKSFDADDFDVMIDEAKKAGWKIRKEDEGWAHYCPSC